VKEIVDASGYSSNSKVQIVGKLNKIDISVMSPEWNFELELESSNGKKMLVKEQYKFEFSFWSNSNKCQQLAAAFGPAVRYLSEKIVNNPAFPELFKP
jgi:hypothetical protein